MRRWAVPLVVVGVLLASATVIALLPVKAEDHSCGASSFAIVTGADVPEEHAHDCHEQARTDMYVAALPAGAGLVALVLTAAVLRGAKREEREQAAV
jgi:hypothetical protein